VTTKEQDLKNRLAAVVKDMHEQGSKDAEAMWLMGSIASAIVDQGKAKSWSALRPLLTPADFDKLVTTFKAKGEEFVAEGKVKAAYAVQALAVCVVAGTQADPMVVEGARLLDIAIDRSILFFRQNPPIKTN
jgi:hypothetical protein